MQVTIVFRPDAQAPYTGRVVEFRGVEEVHYGYNATYHPALYDGPRVAVEGWPLPDGSRTGSTYPVRAIQEIIVTDEQEH